MGVWYDQWEIRVVDPIAERIQDGIISSSYLIVALSPHSVRSRLVREDLDTALFRQISDCKIRVLPVLKEVCNIPPTLRAKKYADSTTSYLAGFAETIRAIDAPATRA